MNMFGIVPYTFTPTSHIVVTFGMSLSIFLGVTILGFVNYKSDFLAMFMPAGAPLGLAPFLVIIEFISHTAKAVSLGVRLAANIIAGHLLFSILSGFAFTMFTAGGLLTLASILPMLIIIFITILEMAVAVVQAYVFCLLTSIYYYYYFNSLISVLCIAHYHNFHGTYHHNIFGYGYYCRHRDRRGHLGLSSY